MSIVEDFRRSGAEIGLVVSADGSFTDSDSEAYLKAAQLKVVKSIADVSPWLSAHVGAWFSQQQREERDRAIAEVERQHDALALFVKRSLRVPASIARPGILKGVDDIVVTRVRNVVVDTLAAELADGEARVIIDLDLTISILEQPAVWHSEPEVGVGEYVSDRGLLSRMFDRDYRERTVPARAWVEGKYTGSGTGPIQGLTFVSTSFGSYDDELVNLLADVTLRERYVDPDESEDGEGQ